MFDNNCLSNNKKIFLMIISCLLTYKFTNLSKRTINTTDSTLYNLFYHNEGAVCPFGVLCGKLFIIITIIISLLLYNNSYSSNIKLFHFILLILAILFAFINIPLLIKLIPVFILQFIVIYF